MADLPAMVNEAMAEVGPFLFGNEVHEIAFDLDGIGEFAEAKPAAEPANVGVHGDARDVEGVAEDDVGCLAGDAGQRQQFLHGAGDRAAVLLDQKPAALLNIAGLVAEKAGGADHVLQLGAVGLRERGGIGITAEEGRSDHVDALVGTLGGQDGGDQELQWIGEGQGAMRVGIEPGRWRTMRRARLRRGLLAFMSLRRNICARHTYRTAEDYFAATLSLMGAVVRVTAPKPLPVSLVPAGAGAIDVL